MLLNIQIRSDPHLYSILSNMDSRFNIRVISVFVFVYRRRKTNTNKVIPIPAPKKWDDSLACLFKYTYEKINMNMLKICKADPKFATIISLSNHSWSTVMIQILHNKRFLFRLSCDSFDSFLINYSCETSVKCLKILEHKLDAIANFKTCSLEQ